MRFAAVRQYTSVGAGQATRCANVYCRSQTWRPGGGWRRRRSDALISRQVVRSNRGSELGLSFADGHCELEFELVLSLDRLTRQLRDSLLTGPAKPPQQNSTSPPAPHAAPNRPPIRVKAARFGFACYMCCMKQWAARSTSLDGTRRAGGRQAAPPLEVAAAVELRCV
jgi:hypothetical protein